MHSLYKPITMVYADRPGTGRNSLVTGLPGHRAGPCGHHVLLRHARIHLRLRRLPAGGVHG